ncbi:phospholipase A2 [Actinomadura fulvescens]|uniref:Uncharacterized protein n=1 Tax=Actinomadura fulvescens TaxID=46160 RepID=A0ABN3QZ09_9ACTN
MDPVLRGRVGRAVAMVTALFAILSSLTVLTVGAPRANADLIGQSQYVPLGPTPLLDTRSGNGAAAAGKVPAKGSVTFQVSGRAGIPASGVSAVALKVEAVAPTEFGWLTMYPSGSPTINATVTFSANENTTGADYTRITSTGKVTVVNESTAPVHVLVDVRGYFRDATTVEGGNEYYPLPTAFVHDTRPGYGLGTETKAPIPANGSRTFQVAGVAGMPSTGSTAIAMNVLAMNHKTNGWLSVHPSDQPDPRVSTVAFTPGEYNSNFEVARLTSTGKLTITNHNDTTVDISVTLRGYYKVSGGPGGTRYKPVTSQTILQTLDGTGVLEPEGSTAPLGAGKSLTFDAAGTAGVLADRVEAAAINIGARRPTNSGWLSVYPAGSPDPKASVVNYGKDGDTTNGFDLARPDDEGFVTITNHGSAPVHIQVSLRGYHLTPAASALHVDLPKAEPLDEITLTATDLPGDAGPVQVTSPVIEGGSVTLTRPAEGDDPTGTAAVVQGTIPGTYALTGKVGASSQTISFPLEVVGPGTTIPDKKGISLTVNDVPEAGVLIPRGFDVNRAEPARPDQKLFGPGWRPEILGSIGAGRLDDRRGEGYVEITDLDGNATRYTKGADGGYTSAEGGSMSVDTTGKIMERPASGLVVTWSAVGDAWLITAVVGSNGGTSVITYNQQGQVERVVTPVESDEGAAPASCGATPGPGCMSAGFSYASDTTATGSTIGDYKTQLSTISLSADAGTAAFVAASYKYDESGRLREVTSTGSDGAKQQENYTYDTAGNITSLSSGERGYWTFSYGPDGQLTRQVKEPMASVAAARCQYASDWMWGRSGCFPKKRNGKTEIHYAGSWRRVRWAQTRTGFWVVVVKHDHCTKSSDTPGGFDFRPACDNHDYGRALMYRGYLPRKKKGAIDSVFYTTMRDKTCPYYKAAAARCKGWAKDYYRGVTWSS